MGKIVLVLVSIIIILVCETTYYAYGFSACTDTGSNYTKGSVFETNLNRLLTNLTSKSSSLKFYNTEVGDTTNNKVYGLYQCRNDIGLGDCNQCLKTATREIIAECPLYKEAVKWYIFNDYCIVRYANHNIFSLAETDPAFYMANPKNVSSFTKFAPVLNKTLTELIQNASSSGLIHFASAKTNWSSFEQLYGFAQCTPDIDKYECYRCLKESSDDLTTCCSANQGARMLRPSCFIRFEIYPFLNETALSQTTSPPLAPPPTTPHPPDAPGGGNQPSLKPAMIGAIAGGVSVIGLILLAVMFWICVCRKKPNEAAGYALPASSAMVLQDDGSGSLRDTEFTQYSFATVKAATRDFSDENVLGKGGFGIVYKGTSENGEQLAIKRLSSTSGQGTKEFMAEARFLAKLQHNNLVKLVGFCSEGNEKLLVYEFMSNSSLERFLFDPIQRTLLDWVARSKIIMGIAKGLQYLHEDSRLTVVHRDLKPENILLDKEMNPKIADFGLARLIEVAQSSGTTSRIIGTRGYMAPECLIGEYSIKSDVYSFGVMLLEIVSGKNNRMFYQSSKQDDLPYFAWRLWNEGRSFELTDPELYNNCPRDEVTRCIQIGLLCLQANAELRPKISSVVFMLTGLGNLPLPTAPGTSFPQLGVPTTHSGGKYSETDPHSINLVTMQEGTAHDLYPKPR